MNTPNILAPVAEKARDAQKWLTAVGIGFVAVAGPVVLPAAAQAESASNGSQTEMVYNIGANPYHMSDAERGAYVEAREKMCGGIFSPEKCWDFTGYSSNLMTQGLIKFTPVIPIPGSNTEVMTNDTFAIVPAYVPEQQK